jgi:hypothetical protein
MISRLRTRPPAPIRRSERSRWLLYLRGVIAGG